MAEGAKLAVGTEGLEALELGVGAGVGGVRRRGATWTMS